MEKNVLSPAKTARPPRAKKLAAATPERHDAWEVTFPQGLIGCPDWQRFRLAPIPFETCGELIALDAPGVSLLVANPAWLQVNYNFELDEDDVEALRLTAAEDAVVCCVLTLRPEAPSITTNLAGPIIINRRELIGRQVILDHSAYPLRAPVVSGDAARAFIEAWSSASDPEAAHSTPAAQPEKGA